MQARAAEPTSAEAWSATAALHVRSLRPELALEAYAMACTLGAGAESHLQVALGLLKSPSTAVKGGCEGAPWLRWHSPLAMVPH